MTLIPAPLLQVTRRFTWRKLLIGRASVYTKERYLTGFRTRVCVFSLLNNIKQIRERNLTETELHNH